MLRTYSLQTYTGLSLVKGGNEAPALVLHIQSLALSLKVGIELWQFLPEVFNATLEERVRYEKILFYIFLFYTISSLTERMTSFLMTSVPLRSMRGSGSL